MKLTFLSAMTVLSMSSCPPEQTTATPETSVTAADTLPYQLETPDITFDLTDEYTEISALSLSPNAGKLLFLSDEYAKICELDLTSGKVNCFPPFMEDGDFEGLEWVDGTAYTLKSNGKVYAVKGLGTEAQKADLIRTALSKPDDCEGLCFDATGQRLLISAKGPAELRLRRVFGLYPAENRLDTLVTITQEDFVAALKHQHEGAEKSFKKFFEELSSEFKLAPSSIAISPIDGDWYLLSSVGKWLVVLDGNTHRIKSIVGLEKKIHTQPEGMTFGTDGTLWISNEGKPADGDKAAKPARVYGFKRKG